MSFVNFINESERSSILKQHKAHLPERFTRTIDTSSLGAMLYDFREELDYQKKIHLARISEMDATSKMNYIREVQDTLVLGIFGNQATIVETYNRAFKQIILESNFQFEQNLEKFNKFLFQSLLFSSGVLKEGWGDWLSDAWDATTSAVSSAWDATKQAAQYVGDKAVQAVQYVGDKAVQAGKMVWDGAKWVAQKFVDAYQYLKEKGIDWVMEYLRGKAMGGWGLAIQIALGTTGWGNIGLMIFWGIFAIYDAYQALNNNQLKNWIYLICDIISILTAGLGTSLFAPIVSKIALVGKGLGAGIKSMPGKIVAFLAETGVLAKLKGFISGIVKGGQTLLGWLQKGADFMLNKLGIKWVGNLVGRIKGVFDEFATWIQKFSSAAVTQGKNVVNKTQALGRLGRMKAGTQMTKLAGGAQSLFTPAVGATMRKLPIIGTRLAGPAFDTLKNMTAKELGLLVNKKVSDLTVETAKKYLNNFKDKTVGEFLTFLDKQGLDVGLGDAYAAYLGAKKILKYNISKEQFGTEQLAGTIASGGNSPYGYTGKINYFDPAIRKVNQVSNVYPLNQVSNPFAPSALATNYNYVDLVNPTNAF